MMLMMLRALRVNHEQAALDILDIARYQHRSSRWGYGDSDRPELWGAFMTVLHAAAYLELRGRV